MSGIIHLINCYLSQMAETIQLNSSSFFAWGEPELPEKLRKEFETKQQK